jgi:hypothetical protein
MEAKIHACRVLVGNSDGKRPLGRLGCRLDGNIEMDCKEIGWGLWTGFIWLRIGTSGKLL